MPNSSLTPDNQTYTERAFTFIKQLLVTLMLHKDSYDFIRENRPWQGLRQHRWMTVLMIVSALFLGYQFFSQIWDWVSTASSSQQVFSAGFPAVFENLSFEKMEWVLHGGKKYLVLVVLEIITFHFVRQVLEIRTGLKSDSSFKAFIGAEVRMIKVSVMAWVMESIFIGLANAVLGIVGFDFFKWPVGLAIQFYFLGFSLIDNYLECYGWKIKDSEKLTRLVAGVAVATGMVAFLLMYVPLVGVILATMLGAVTATLGMERFAPEVALGGVLEEKMEKKKSNRT